MHSHLFGILAVLLLGGAEPALTRSEFAEPHMGTLFRIIAYAPDKDSAGKAAKDAFARIASLNAIMSDYDKASELMRLCAQAGGPPVPVSRELFFVLSRAQEVSRQSGGAFDVTVGPLVKLWRQARKERKLPDAKKLAEARALVDWRNIRLDADKRTVQLLKAGMQLDLGGIAKGYAADEALAVLKKHGIDSALVAAGGDIAVSGPPPGADGWKIAIATLPDEKDPGRLILHHAAVSTSGDAEQFVEIDGKRYSHIVDPRTGIGLIGRMSATVAARRGIDADSLTKVAAVLGPEKGIEIIEANEGASARMVREKGEQFETIVSKRFPKLHPVERTSRSEPKKIAAIVTVYTHWSHADVIVGKILEGYNYDGGAGPNLKVVSMYVDQTPERDMSRALAKKHGFTISRSIADALTLGGDKLAVDGVLCIGEHGDYPKNAKGQTLYPRRRFFEEVCKVFEKSKKSVPVFTDKHLSATWTDAKWMYDRARQLSVPLMAGSSIPLAWRRPELRLDKGCPLVEAVQVGYGPFEAYGFHALEGLQCMAERRKGGETGVRAVQCLQGPAMWEALDKDRWSKPLLEAALERVPAHAKEDIRTATAKAKDAGVFLIEYRDGLRAAVVLPNGWIHEGDGGGFTFAGRLQDADKLVSTHFYLQQPDPFAHFAYLVKAIDSLMQTGRSPYPVERTLLTTGILDAVMTSRAEKHRRIETPHLAIEYEPADWPFAVDPVPKTIER